MYLREGYTFHDICMLHNLLVKEIVIVCILCSKYFLCIILPLLKSDIFYLPFYIKI